MGISLANSSVISVQELRPFSSDSPRSSLSDTVLGPPINGQAYNGIEFNLTDADPFVLARRDATALQLPAAVFQLAEQSERGLFDSFLDDTLANYANEVYVRCYILSSGLGILTFHFVSQFTFHWWQKKPISCPIRSQWASKYRLSENDCG